MKISENFEKKQIKSFSLNFDKKLIRHIQELKSPDKRIKKARRAYRQETKIWFSEVYMDSIWYRLYTS